MAILDFYKTISVPTSGSYKEKGSKFLAFAYPINTEDAIKEILEHLKKEYHDARHHCYAWRLGPAGEFYRINDDGEPSGTAGKPIYGQLLSHNLSNILVVVVRYFGGVKLGVGGLINAYRCASQDALEQATIIERTVNDVFRIDFEYIAMNDVMRIVKDFELDVIHQEFDLHCMLQFSHRQSEIDLLKDKLEKIESLRIQWLRTE